MTLIDFHLPDVGEGLSQALIVEWLVSPGDSITEDSALLVIETDKAQVEIPSPVTGTLREVVAPADQTVPVGAVLARFEAQEAMAIEPTVHPNGRIQTSPFVRRYAKKNGIDLATVTGTGRNGRITAADIRALEPPVETPQPRPQSPAGGTSITPLRRQIAATLATAWRDVPHVFDWRTADAVQLIELRNALRKRHTELAALTYLPLIVKLVSAALKEHPWINSALRDERITVMQSHDIGIATATDEGLVVPVVGGVERLSVLDLTAALSGVIEQTRARSTARSTPLRPTITVNNLGAVGGLHGTPLIVPPQIAIVAFGRIEDRVVAVDGLPVVRPALPLTVGVDHRALDGDKLCAFMSTLVELVQNPALALARSA